jgi:hypothetical protein
MRTGCRKTHLLALVAATLVCVSAAAAEPPPDPAGAPAAQTRAFGDAVRDAWSQAARDAQRAGRAIGDSARSFGRATRETATSGWRRLRAAFGG